MKRFVLLTIISTVLAGAIVVPAKAEQKLPNFVILFADDLGYGDLGCYGHPTIKTPNLDRMAAEGMRFTQFYATECVCSPSRAALMTGRYPIRSGMCGDNPRVIVPDSIGGLPESEITIAEALKTKGYATCCVGKWHLGHKPQYLPTSNGFDSYFGIPYSNDMKPTVLMRNSEVIEDPVVQKTLTPRYTEEALAFIKQNKDKPVFLYLPYTFPHVPLFASDRFKGKSLRGLYGDVVEEVDWSVGEILNSLREQKLAEQTLVFFTSDNGPWLTRGLHGGSAGLLRDGKGSTWEGGMREPAIAWWPGKIKSGTVNYDLACTLDLFPTCLKLAGIDLPTDRIIDGVDMAPILFSTGPAPRRVFFYYRGFNLMAVRKGPWKAHLMTQPAYGPDSQKNTSHDPPLLYNLQEDPSEQYNLAEKNPQVIADLLAEVKLHKDKVVPGTCQFTTQPKSQEPEKQKK